MELSSFHCSSFIGYNDMIRLLEFMISLLLFFFFLIWGLKVIKKIFYYCKDIAFWSFYTSILKDACTCYEKEFSTDTFGHIGYNQLCFQLPI